MRKLSVKEIVEFRGKSDKAKGNFASNLKQNKIKLNEGSGGDYWISCLSALSNGYKSNSIQLTIDKINELKNKFDITEYKKTKTMYERNINILNNYMDFDLKKWKPTKKISFIKKHKDNAVLSIKDIRIQVQPHHVFTFQSNGVNQIGAIWFIAKLNGFRKDELGVFTDILYKYLKTHYSNDYDLSSKYCIAVDVFNNSYITYAELESGEIPSVLNLILDELKGLI